MTEAQLERLRLGREKALAVRRAKAQEKKELKELQDKKKKKDIQKLREEVDDKPKPAPAPAPRKTITSLDDLPADMLIELQKRAIEGYDTKRKARKEQKKKQQQEETDNLKNMYLVNNALQPQRPPQYGEAGFFRDCF